VKLDGVGSGRSVETPRNSVRGSCSCLGEVAVLSFEFPAIVQSGFVFT